MFLFNIYLNLAVAIVTESGRQNGRHMCEELVPIINMCKELVPILHI